MVASGIIICCLIGLICYYQMKQAEVALEELCEEQSQSISAEPARDSASAQLAKQKQYTSTTTNKTSKVPIILLLLILFTYVFFSLFNAGALMDSNESSPGEQRPENVISVVHISEPVDNFKKVHLAKEQYLKAKDRFDTLTQREQLDQVDDMLRVKYEMDMLLATETDSAAIERLQNGESTSKLKLPPTLWIYLSQPLQRQGYINSLTINNNVRLAAASNFTLNYLQRDNYRQYLMAGPAQELDEVIRAAEGVGRNFEDLQQVIKYLIIVTVMKQVGGVFIEEYVSLLEDFEWIEDIANNIFVNRGSRNIEPQVVGFHSVQNSSPLLRQNKPQIVEVKQYMRLFPALEHYFLAARRNSNFFKALRDQLYENAMKTDQQLLALVQELKRSKAYSGSQGSVWKDLFTITSQQVLLREQVRLQKEKSETLFAIDSYGLKTINKHYFPYKFQFIFTRYQFQKTYTHLAKHPLYELEANVGPLRYVAVITPRGDIEYLLSKAKERNSQRAIVKGSFLQVYLFNQSSESFIVDNEEKPVKKEDAPQWSNLPKIIWLFWDKGMASSHATNQLAKRNLEKYANLSGFKVVEVNQTNLREYIGLSELEKIEDVLYFNNRGSKYDQTYSDLVRLALLMRHGGVYMDASFMLLESLDWLVNIAAYPSEFIFNRYGELPSVFMFFNPQYGSPYDEWRVDPNHNTKAHWHLSYQNNFIACQPKNELIIAWYEALINYLSQPYSKTEQQFKQCGIQNHQWSTQNYTYLLPMDTIKCVLGNKEKELQKGSGSAALSPASEHFKIWSMSGYNGVQKFRAFTNFQSPGSDDNLFFRRYSEHFVTSLLGGPRHLMKLYNQNNIQLNSFIRDNLEGRIFHEMHPQSFFSKYLFGLRRQEEDFIIINGNLLIKQKP